MNPFNRNQQNLNLNLEQSSMVAHSCLNETLNKCNSSWAKPVIKKNQNKI